MFKFIIVLHLLFLTQLFAFSGIVKGSASNGCLVDFTIENFTYDELEDSWMNIHDKSVYYPEDIVCVEGTFDPPVGRIFSLPNLKAVINNFSLSPILAEEVNLPQLEEVSGLLTITSASYPNRVIRKIYIPKIKKGNISIHVSNFGEFNRIESITVAKDWFDGLNVFTDTKASIERLCKNNPDPLDQLYMFQCM